MDMDSFDASDFSGLSFESGFENLLRQGTSSTSEPQQRNDQTPDQFLGPQCLRCAKYRADKERSDREHRVNFQFLKKKIISTDQLIRRCKAKQDESEALTKMVEDLNVKLEHANRDSTILSEQLASAVEEMKPLKEANIHLENSLREKTREVNDLYTKLAADEAYRNQKQALDSETKNLETEILSLKRKILGLENKKQKLVTKNCQLDRENASLTTEKNIFTNRLGVFAKALQQAQDIVSAQWRKLQMSGLTEGRKRPYVIPTKYKSFIAKVQAGDEKEALITSDKEETTPGDEDKEEVGGANASLMDDDGSRSRKEKEAKKKRIKNEKKDAGGEEDDDCDGGLSDVSVFSETDEEMGEDVIKNLTSITKDTKVRGNNEEPTGAGKDGEKNEGVIGDSKVKVNEKFETKTKKDSKSGKGMISSFSSVGDGVKSGVSSADRGKFISMGKIKGKTTKSVESGSKKLVMEKQEAGVTKDDKEEEEGDDNDDDDLSSLSSSSDDDLGNDDEDENKKKMTKRDQLKNAGDLSVNSNVRNTKNSCAKLFFDSEKQMNQLSRDKSKTVSPPKINFTWKMKNNVDGRNGPGPICKGSFKKKELKKTGDLGTLSSLSEDSEEEEIGKCESKSLEENKKEKSSTVAEENDIEYEIDNEFVSLPFTHMNDTGSNMPTARVSSRLSPGRSRSRGPSDVEEVMPGGSVGKEELKSILFRTMSSLFQALSPLPPSPHPVFGDDDDEDESKDNEDIEDDGDKEMRSEETTRLSSIVDKDDDNEDDDDVKEKSSEETRRSSSNEDKNKDHDEIDKDGVEERSCEETIKSTSSIVDRGDHYDDDDDLKEMKSNGTMRLSPIVDEENIDTKDCVKILGEGGDKGKCVEDEERETSVENHCETSVENHCERSVENHGEQSVENHCERSVENHSENEDVSHKDSFSKKIVTITDHIENCVDSNKDFSGNLNEERSISSMVENSGLSFEEHSSNSTAVTNSNNSRVMCDNDELIKKDSLNCFKADCTEIVTAPITMDTVRIEDRCEAKISTATDNVRIEHERGGVRKTSDVTVKKLDKDGGVIGDEIVLCGNLKNESQAVQAAKKVETESKQHYYLPKVTTPPHKGVSDDEMDSKSVVMPESDSSCINDVISQEKEMVACGDSEEESKLSRSGNESKETDVDQSIASFRKESEEIPQTVAPMLKPSLNEKEVMPDLSDKTTVNRPKDPARTEKRTNVDLGLKEYCQTVQSEEVLSPNSMKRNRSKTEEGNVDNDLVMSLDDSDSEGTIQSDSEVIKLTRQSSKHSNVSEITKTASNAGDSAVKSSKVIKKPGAGKTATRNSGDKIESEGDFSLSSQDDDDDNIDESDSKTLEKSKGLKETLCCEKDICALNFNVSPVSTKENFVSTKPPVRRARGKTSLDEGNEDENGCPPQKDSAQKVKGATRRKIVSKEFVELSSLSDSGSSDGEERMKGRKTGEEEEKEKEDKMGKGGEEAAVGLNHQGSYLTTLRRSSKTGFSYSSNVNWNTDDDSSRMRVTRSRSGSSSVGNGNGKRNKDVVNSPSGSFVDKSSKKLCAEAEAAIGKGMEKFLDAVDDMSSGPDLKGVVCKSEVESAALSRKTQMECASQQLAKMIARAKAGNKSKLDIKKDTAGVHSISAAQSALSARSRSNAFPRRTRTVMRKTCEETSRGNDQKEGSIEEVKKQQVSNPLLPSDHAGGEKKMENKDDVREVQSCDKNSDASRTFPVHKPKQSKPERRLTRSLSSKVDSGNVLTSLDCGRKDQAPSVSKLEASVINESGDSSCCSDIPVRVRKSSLVVQMADVHREKCSGTGGLDSTTTSDNIRVSPKLVLDDRLNESGGFTMSVSSVHSTSTDSRLNDQCTDKGEVSDLKSPNSGKDGKEDATQKHNNTGGGSAIDRTPSISSDLQQGTKQDFNAVTDVIKSKTGKTNDSSGLSVKLAINVSGNNVFSQMVPASHEDRLCAGLETTASCGVSDRNSVILDKDNNDAFHKPPRPALLPSLLPSVNSAFSPVESSVNVGMCASSTNRVLIPSSPQTSSSLLLSSSSSSSTSSLLLSTSSSLLLSSTSSSSLASNENICDNRYADSDQESKKPKNEISSTLENVSVLKVEEKILPVSQNITVVVDDKHKVLNLSQPLEIIIPATTISSSSVSHPSSSILSSSSMSSLSSQSWKAMLSSSNGMGTSQSSRGLKRPFSQVLSDMVNFFKIPRLLSPVSSPTPSPTPSSVPDKNIDDADAANPNSVSLYSHHTPATHNAPEATQCSDSQMMNKARKLLAKRKASTPVEERQSGSLSVGVKRSKRLALEGGKKDGADDSIGKTVRPKQKTISFSGFSSVQDAVDYCLRHFLSRESHDPPDLFSTVDDLVAQGKDGNIAEVWHCLANKIIAHLRKSCPQFDPWLQRVLCGGSSTPLQDDHHHKLTTQTRLEPTEVSILQLVTAFSDKHSEAIDMSVLMGSLWSAIFDQSLTSTGVRLSLCRLFCALCKHRDDCEEARVLLHSIAWCGYIPFSPCLMSILGVWPSIVPPIGGGGRKSDSLPPICRVFELVVSMERKEEPQLVERMQTVIEKLCGWTVQSKPIVPNRLLKWMVDTMTDLARDSKGQANLFEYMKAIELLCVVQGSAWTQDHFVQKTLVGSFQKWYNTSALLPLSPLQSEVVDVMVALLKITKAVLAVQSFSETTVNVLTGQVFGKIVVTKLDSLPLTVSFGEVLMELSPLYPDRSLELLRQWEETNQSDLPPYVLGQLSQTRTFVNARKKTGGVKGGNKAKKGKKKKKKGQ